MIATIEVSGARKDISVVLLPEPVKVGEYVLVHAGFAIQKIDEEAAQEAIRLLSEMVQEMEREEQAPDIQSGGMFF